MQQRFPILQRKRGVALVIAIMVLPLFGLLGLLALRNRGGNGSDSAGGAGSSGLVTDDTYFYGQSEPVYPSRKYPYLYMCQKIYISMVWWNLTYVCSNDDGFRKMG